MQDFEITGEQIQNEALTLLPDILTGLVILVIGFFLGLIVKKIVKKCVVILNKKLNLRLQESTLNVDLKQSASFIGTAFFWIIFSTAILICIHILKLDFLDEQIDRVIRFMPNIIAAILIIFAGILLGRLLSDLVQSNAKRSGLAGRGFAGIAVRYFVLLIACITAADQLGIHIDFLTDVIDIILGMFLFGASLAFALGAKTAVRNIFGSYYARKDHQIGTRIRYGNTMGTITKISGHSVHLNTEEGRLVVPAKKFSELEVTILKEEDV